MHMGTVVVQEGLKFKINANDHGPPHVHIEGKGSSVRIDLRTLRVMGKTDFAPADIRKIIAAVADYHDVLMEKWNEYHEKG